MGPAAPLALLLLCLPGCVAGDGVYQRIQLHEGQTMSVQCSYKGRRNPVDHKIWCKVRRKRCETGFARLWVTGPRYWMQDDTKAQVVSITMGTLRHQDSGRYWCMRNSSGILVPLVGFLLEVSPANATEGTTPLTLLADVLNNRVVPTGRAPASGAGLLTWARRWPSAASGTPASGVRHGFAGPSPATVVPGRTEGAQWATVPPSGARALSAGPVSFPTGPECLQSGLPAMGQCHSQLPALRLQEPYLTVLVALLTLLPVPVMLAVAYRVWKRRHMGSYRLGSDCTGPWKHPLGSPAPVDAWVV